MKLKNHLNCRSNSPFLLIWWLQKWMGTLILPLLHIQQGQQVVMPTAYFAKAKGPDAEGCLELILKLHQLWLLQSRLSSFSLHWKLLVYFHGTDDLKYSSVAVCRHDNSHMWNIVQKQSIFFCPMLMFLPKNVYVFIYHKLRNYHIFECEKKNSFLN